MDTLAGWIFPILIAVAAFTWVTVLPVIGGLYLLGFLH